MDKEKLKYFKKRLLEEKADTLRTLKQMENHHGTHASIREYTEELSAYDNHPADLGTEMFMVEMQGNLENHERYHITEIDRALDKIENGTYGDCNLCGKTIPEERLEILPEANICMECAKDKMPIEAMQGDRGRPVEEKLLAPPFSRTNMDGKDYTGFDGEDAYQAVARFNEVKNDPSFSTMDFSMVFDDDAPGIVQGVEKITEDEYLEQLPDDELEETLKDKKMHP
ncbi:TraR/DksA C4-type zinc finger protein [Alkaliphilus peptidifermentans]|uniref:Transcriptional regulator, TraR/DksA family n=1 Tax=Alkaliphilus peptidifermentans DSM 18978 TaxID=1120976 RepID=A0A1G5BA40_9FIRM|nr:TraR/DksA C4-type zinc finger protein [Alkaliphilus peptidifermentans]SCX86820.1 transcriptional regulator, TraR/DksA family [Alkaliphilus peptidifermentans DSM 18978]